MRKVNIVVVLHGRDVSLVSQLVRVLIERTILLFSIPSFQTVSHTHTCTHAHTHTQCVCVCVCVCVLVHRYYRLVTGIGNGQPSARHPRYL